MSEDICRLCLEKGIEGNFVSIITGQPSIKCKISILMPELNLEVIEDAVICRPCLSMLESAYQLKIKCLQTEEKIWRQLNSPVKNKSLENPVKLINLIRPSNEEDEEIAEPFNLPEIRVKSIIILNGIKTSPTKKHEKIVKNLNVQINLDDAYTCPTCKKHFLTSEELHLHIPEHLKKQPFMCTYCYKCFTLKTNLNTHMRTHTQDRPFGCGSCHKTFTTKGNLKTHIRVHTKEKPYVCYICEKSFIQKVQLNTHLLLHENKHMFKCNVCAKSFASKSTLSVHKRIHNDIKPYVCEFCNKGFTTNGNLMVHTRTHTGETPYECGQCTKAFTQQNQLKLHLKSHLETKKKQ